MGGKVWSPHEEEVFWRDIVPLAPPGNDATSKKVKDPSVRKQWKALAVKMRDAMTALLGPGETIRRKYGHVSCYEHYFQNYYRLEHYSPNSQPYVEEYKAKLERAIGTGGQISVNRQPFNITNTRNVAPSQSSKVRRRNKKTAQRHGLKATNSHQNDAASGALPKADGESTKDFVEESNSEHLEVAENKALEKDTIEAANTLQQMAQPMVYRDQKEYQQQLYYDHQMAHFQSYARPQTSQYMTQPFSALHGGSINNHTGYGHRQVLYGHPPASYGYYSPQYSGFTPHFNMNAFNSNYAVPPNSLHTCGGPPELTGGGFNGFEALSGYRQSSGQVFGNVRADQDVNTGPHSSTNGYGRSGPPQRTSQVVSDGLANSGAPVDPSSVK